MFNSLPRVWMQIVVFERPDIGYHTFLNYAKIYNISYMRTLTLLRSYYLKTSLKSQIIQTTSLLPKFLL